jgi:hypothetical protein
MFIELAFLFCYTFLLHYNMKRNISYYFFLQFLSILIVLMYVSLWLYIRKDYKATEGPAMALVAGVSITCIWYYIDKYLDIRSLRKR